MCNEGVFVNEMDRVDTGTREEYAPSPLGPPQPR